MDVYLDSFLTEVGHLTHSGLVKRYRIAEGNLYKLKGRIQFAQHLRRNLLHRERIFTAHQIYDRDNEFNRVLKCALSIVKHLPVRTSLASRAAAALLSFEDVADGRITAVTFDRLKFRRNTECYRRAIQLARLIILNFCPDLQGGSEHVVAILFDMNKLFERFILVQIRRTETLYANRALSVTGQMKVRFWCSKHIRPDIVADFDLGMDKKRVILDTKWKVPKDGQPSDEDLKQMYAYNLHLGGSRSVLVYPRAGIQQEDNEGVYAQSAQLTQGLSHVCATYFVDLFDASNRLRKNIGNELTQKAILKSG